MYLHIVKYESLVSCINFVWQQIIFEIYNNRESMDLKEENNIFENKSNGIIYNAWFL